MSKLASMDEFIDNHINGKVIDMNNPKCIKCNSCCTMGAYITKKEYKTIKKYLTTTPNGIALYKKAMELIIRHRKEGAIYWICPFSGEYSKKCGIYHIRPKVCRDFHCKSELNKLGERPLKNPEEYMIANLFYDFENNK